MTVSLQSALNKIKKLKQKRKTMPLPITHIEERGSIPCDGNLPIYELGNFYPSAAILSGRRLTYQVKTKQAEKGLV